MTQQNLPQTTQPTGLLITERVRLDAQRLPSYLQEKGLLSPRDVVDDGLQVQDLSRRNLNFSAKVGGTWGFLVKQVGTGTHSTDFTQLRAEADALHHLNNEPVFASLHGMVPELRYYDPDNGIVVTELVTPGTSLTKYHLNAGDVHFPADGAVTVATILATFHDAGTRAVEQGVTAHMTGKLPLGLMGYVNPYAGNQAKAKRLFDEYARERPHVQRVQGLMQDWGRHAAMFHGDIRLDNFLLTAGAGGDGGLNLKLIDWELAGVGDSLWDVACLYADYLRFWAMCAANCNPADADDFWTVAPFSLTDLAPFLHAFWDAYCAGRGWDAGRRREEEARLRSILPVQTLGLGWEYVSNVSKDAEVEELPPLFWVMARIADELEDHWDDRAAAWLGLGGETDE